jgi:hypothetical protein
VGTLALWWLIAWVFSSDRGIGFRDEGLYLLAADPPSSTARWVTPFGWHTAPFFDLVGHDVARLRTLSIWVLVLTGALLGWTIGRRVTDDESTREHLAIRIGLATVGAFGAPLLTAGFLRTPGYNWVNLVGLMLACTGAVLAVMLADHDGSLWRTRRAHVAAAVLTLGMWFTVPAKPSSAPLFILVALAYVAPRLRRRTGTFALVATAWGLGWTALGLLARWWPIGFLGVLRKAEQFPPLDRNQTIGGAVRDVLRTPKVAWNDLTQLRPATVALMTIAAVIAVAAFRRQQSGTALRTAPLAIAVVAAIGTAAPWPLLGEPSPASRFSWYGTTNAAVLLFVGAMLHLVAHWRDTTVTRRRHGLALAGLCIAATVVFGFGSAMSVYHQAALAATLMWCAAAAVVATVGAPRLRSGAVGAVAIAAFAMFATNTLDSRAHAFDIGDIATQTTPVRFGAHDDELLVDTDTAAFLERLQTDAAAGGLCHGTRLIGMVWQWTSTTAFAVAATVPEHLILTIFGYPESASVLDVTIDDLTLPEWRDAWVATTNPDTLEPGAAAELRAALDRLPGSIGRAFPDDYTLVSDLDGLQLWRPAGAPTTPCTDA